MQKDNFTRSIIPSEVHVVLVGKHHRKSDLDNCIAAVIDALVQAEYLKDDSMMYITKLSAELKHSADSPFVLITLV